MSATINDVAKLANLSVGSVSRFLNGATLKEKNSKLIKEAIETLDYKQNFIAKSLKSNITMTIGILINSLTDIFSASIIEAAEKILASHNYTMLICNYNKDNEKQEERLRYLLEKKVDGAILYLIGDYQPILIEYIEKKIPFVLVNEQVEGITTDTVIVDNEKGSFEAVSKLITNNHKRIGIICGRNDPTSNERLNGYIKAHEQLNIAIDKSLIVNGWYNSKLSYNATKDLMNLPNPPTALFVISYDMTMGTIIALNELNLKIPNDISVIGFDYFELSNVIQPLLTLVEEPTEQMGIVAAEIIMKRLSGDYSDYPVLKVLNTKLCDRDSVKEYQQNPKKQR